MTILLLIVIYIAFIGLGVPDSLIGSAWPAIYPEFGIPVDSVSCVTLLISGCTVLSSMFSDRLLNRFGTAKVTVFSTAMTALALLGFSVSNRFVFLCLLAIPLGLGAGAIDSGLNNYIALHYSASHMNFLHCFYGVGVSASPYLMSLALAENTWREGYRSAFLVQISITAILLFSLPLWKKTSAKTQETQEEVIPQTLSLKQMWQMPEVRTVWVIMLATNAIEYACGTWGSTWLVESRGFTPEDAAFMITLYYAGMALGRFLSGVLANRIATWKRIGIGIVGVLIAVAVLPFSAIGLFLVGLGNGSIYPNLIHLTPVNFGESVSQSIMGSQIATAYLGVMLAPPLFGLVSNLLGIQVFPWFLIVLFVIMTVFLFIFTQQMKKNGRFITTV